VVTGGVDGHHGCWFLVGEGELEVLFGWIDEDDGHLFKFPKFVDIEEL
jgi:hypothetical protein